MNIGTTRPPRAAATSDAISCRWYRSGAVLFTSGVFQLRWRFAAADMSAISSMSSSLNPRRKESGMNSMLVPGCQPHTSLSADELVARREVRRRRTPVAVDLRHDVRSGEAEAAGGDRLGEELAHRGRAARRSPRSDDAAAPITARRIAEWPTMKPMLGPSGSDSTTSRNSGNVFHRNVDARGERLDRDRLDPREQAGQEVFVAGFDRGEREAAVAADHRGHAVER